MIFKSAFVHYFNFCFVPIHPYYFSLQIYRLLLLSLSFVSSKLDIQNLQKLLILLSVLVTGSMFWGERLHLQKPYSTQSWQLSPNSQQPDDKTQDLNHSIRGSLATFSDSLCITVLPTICHCSLSSSIKLLPVFKQSHLFHRVVPCALTHTIFMAWPSPPALEHLRKPPLCF